MKTTLLNEKTLLAAVACGAVGTSLIHASSDYGPAIWNPIANNYYTTGYGHKFLVIHVMEGWYGTCRQVFINNGTSVHFAVNSGSGTSSGGYTDIDGKPAGEISQFVLEANYGWDATCWNKHHVGTEHEGFTGNPAWFTEAQYQASALMQRHLCDKFGIPKDRNHIVGHNEKSSAAWVAWAPANLGINATCNTHNDPGPYWDWTHFMDLVNQTPSTQIRLDTFVRGTDNQLWQKYYDLATGWYPSFLPLGGAMTSDPAAVSWGVNRVDVFYKGSTNQLAHKFWTGTAWSGVESLGVTLAGKPAASSRGNGQLDVFIRGTDNGLYHKWYVNNAWNPSVTGFETLGGTMASDPCSVSWAGDRIDVFYRGTDGALKHKFWTPAGWSSVESLAGGLVGAPAVCSMANGRLDVFCRGTDNALWHKYCINPNWTGWESLGGALTSDPACVAPIVNRCDVFMRGTDNAMWHNWWDGVTWHANESLGGALVGAPAVSSWTKTN